MTQDYKSPETRALEMTGHTTDLQAAFDQWEQERNALQEFHDVNQALSIHTRVISDCAADAMHLVEDIQAAGIMFIPPKIQKQMQSFQEKYINMHKRLAEAIEIANKTRGIIGV